MKNRSDRTGTFAAATAMGLSMTALGAAMLVLWTSSPAPAPSQPRPHLRAPAAQRLGEIRLMPQPRTRREPRWI